MFKIFIIIISLMIMNSFALPHSKLEIVNPFVDVASFPLSSSLTDNQDFSKPLIINTPLSFESEDNQTWDSILEKIQNAKNNQIILRVQGIGGEMFEGNKVIQTLLNIEKDGKIVTMEVLGPSYSMHAFLTCAGNIDIKPGGSLMFHQGGSYETTFFGMIPYKNVDLDPSGIELENFFFTLCKEKGVLTNNDIKQILTGGDVTIIKLTDGSYSKIYSRDQADWVMTLYSIAYTIFLLSFILIFIGLIKKI